MGFVWKCLEFLKDHKDYMSTIALAATWVTIAFVWWRKRGYWLRKEFINQVNFSLNYIADGNLTMRTLLETTAEKVWLNEYGVKMVFSAAGLTTESDPFIRLRDQEDRDFINRAVLNSLSERFPETYVAAALGVPVKTSKFCFAITCEKYKDMRTLKIRVLLVEEATLEKFAPGGGGDGLKLDEPKFRDRIRSLQAMYNEGKKDKHVLGHLELGIVP